jgi:hypothetical protein
MKRVTSVLLLVACTCTGCVWDAQGIFTAKETVAVKAPAPPPTKPQLSAELVNDGNATEIAVQLNEELSLDAQKPALKADSAQK